MSQKKKKRKKIVVLNVARVLRSVWELKLEVNESGTFGVRNIFACVTTML